jgi:type 2 lantibiotic biosynthesis protein LanM
MTKSEFDRIVNQASTISERVDSFRTNRSACSCLPPSGQQALIDAWKLKLGSNPDHWSKRLAWDGLAESEVTRVLAASPYSESNLPPWAAEMRCFMEFSSSPIELDTHLVPEGEPFAEIWKMVRRYAGDRLATLLADYKVRADDILAEAALIDLVEAVVTRLKEISLDTLYHELDQRRPVGMRSFAALLRNLDTLPATDAPGGSECYREFINGILRSGFSEIFTAYPVLGRLVGEILNGWLSNSVLFIVRLRRDSKKLAETFCEGVTEIGLVERLRLPLSDNHNGGQTVVGVRFARVELVYKPKDTSLELDFSKLLEHINPRLKRPFAINDVLCCDGYGWVRCIKRSPCSDQMAVDRFYERFGALLALLYALRATDCHYENIIANGECPQLVDMETLLHPEVGWADDARKLLGSGSPNKAFFDSVLRVGILPSWLFNADETDAYDVSSLGYSEIRNLTTKSRIWRWCNSDLMHPAFRAERVEPPNNVPAIGSLTFDAGEFVDRIKLGFSEAYRQLMDERVGLVESPAFIALKDRPVRFIFRASQLYGTMLTAARSPENLRDGARYSLEFEGLARIFLNCDSKPTIWPLFKAELRQICSQDIPYFSGRSSSTTLELSPGESLTNYFESPGFQDARAKVLSLSEKDLTQQLMLIEGSFLARAGHLSPAKTQDQLPVEDDCEVAAPNVAKLISGIAESLASTALWGANLSCNWFGVAFVASAKRFQLKPLGYNLYEGSTGIGVFFAAQYCATKQADHARLANAATFEVRELISRPLSGVTRKMSRELGIGVGTGLGSIAYGLAKMADFLSDASLAQDANSACRILRENIANDAKFDVIDGAAGGVLAALAVYRLTKDPEVLETAVECGTHLIKLKSAFRSGGQTNWEFDGERPPIGFAHGASGIAYALCSLYSFVRDERFAELAHIALNFEDDILGFSDAAKLRGLPSSWCNGVSGLTLARFKFAESVEPASSKRWWTEGLTGLEALANVPLPEADHLCCGAFGKIDVERYAVEALARLGQRRMPPETAAAVLKRAQIAAAFRLNPTISRNEFFPGLFQGLAGIGYSLLRLEAPQKFPNILAFE